MSVPVFGDPHRDRPIDRPAAYALLHTAEGLAVVRASEGRLFLPGGGIRPGESPEDAVVRELMEECRIRAECIRETCSAIQFFTSREGKRRYRSSMSFWECALLEQLDGPGDHETVWLREVPDEGSFAHEAHAWAVTNDSKAQGSGEEDGMRPSLRRASRLLILDPENRVLLFRYEDAGRTWWATPGGGRG